MSAMLDNTRYDYSAIIKRKPLRWPNNARIALWVIPNIEHFKIDRPSTSANPAMASFVPDVFNYAWRDYGVRVGIWRMMEVMDKHGVPGTVALNAEVCQRYPIIIEEAKKRNWAFMGHGMTNSQMLAGLAEEDERQLIRQVIRTIGEAVGQPPLGWLGPALAETFNTPDILAEEGIRYVCDWCADDQPFPMKVRSGSLISVPYSVDLNDIPAFLSRGASPEEFYRMCADQFDVLYEEGARSGRVMAIALHPFLIGLPFRIKALEMTLAYITGHKDVWVTTGDEIARWYLEHYLD